MELLSVACLHCTVDLTLCIALCRGLALVVELLTLGDTDLDLDSRILEIEGEGDQRVTVALGQHLQLGDLALVHEQLAYTQRIFIEDIALFIGADMASVEEELTVFDNAEAILQIDCALAQGFDLCAEELNACFVSILDKIVVPGLAVQRNDLCAFLCQDRHLLLYNMVC